MAHNVRYEVTLTDGQKFYMAGDFVEASAPIQACFNDPDLDCDWQATPFQTADARHIPKAGASLVASYFATDEDDCIDVESVNVDEARPLRHDPL